MVRRTPEADATPEVDSAPGVDPIDRDERLGAAIEDYLAQAEAGSAPDPESFAASHPDLSEDLKAALEGLAMVRGLVGDPSGPGGRLEAGRRVAGYRIVRELGRGGMGIVYEAVHVDLDRPVALKVLNTHAAPDSSGRRRFLNEAKTAAGLHHTHIVPVFDVGQVGGLCYYAMQRIEGCGLDRVVKSLRKGRSTAAGSGTGKPSADAAAALDLPDATSLGDPTRSWFGAGRAGRPSQAADRIDEAPPFEPPRGSDYYRWVARAGSQAAEALAHAHRRGVVHRDVKPSNLLVDARGTVWVADFGLARRLADPSMTQGDSLLGTPRYMSPEQSEIGPLDGRTDVYSLGATLYELLTLRPPFEGKTAAELIGQIRAKEPAPPRKLDPRLPRDLETIILKAIAKRPSDRYPGAGELAEDLQRFLATEPVKARRIGPVGRGWRFARRHPSLTAVSAIATVAILATATIAYSRVVQERNKALAAKTETQIALNAETTARRELKSAMVQALWRQASFVRISSMPDRRKEGLARLKEAVDLGPDEAMQSKLRDEAVQFLALRDIEPRPSLDTGRVRRLAFSPGTNRLATLSDAKDGSEVRIWDLSRRERLAEFPIPKGENEPREPPGPRSRWWMRPGASLAAARGFVAAIRPGGEGVRLFDATPGTPSCDLKMPGRRVGTLLATPDGRRLVVGDQARGGREPGRDGGPGPRAEPYRVSLWDPARSDAPIATLNDPGPRPDPSGASPPRFAPRFPLLACSPDGKTIALAWFGDAEIVLLNADDGTTKATIEAESFPTSIALGPDGVLAALCAGSVSLWDVETQRPRPGPNLHQPSARILHFSPDGSMLAVAGTVNGIEIWDPESNAMLASVPTAEQVQDLAFSPDGRTLVAAVDETTRAWAVVEPTGRSYLAAPATRPASHLRGLGFGPKGTLAATFSNDKAASARLQCPEGGPTKMTARDLRHTLVLGFGPEGQLVVPDGDALEIYRSPHDRLPESRVPLPEMPSSSFFSGSNDRPPVFGHSRSADGRALVLMRPEDMLLVRFGDAPAPTVGALKFSGFGFGEPRPGSSGRGPRTEDRDRPAPRPSDPRGPGRGPGPEDRDRSRPSGAPWNLTLSPSADRLYLIGDRGELRGWEIRGDRASELDWKGLPRDGVRLALSPDGRVLAFGRQNGEVLLIDSADGSPRGVVPAPEGAKSVMALAFSPGGELAVGLRSGLIRLWSARRDEAPSPLVSLPGPQGEIAMLVYSPDGRRLAVGNDSGADIWDLEHVRSRLAAIGLGW